MKGLTIKEPWASLIVNGYKKYEFRSFNLESDNALKFKDYNLNYGHGEIIGEAYLTDCILVTDEFENELYNINPLVYGKSKHARKYAWKLDNVIMYEKRIPYKGKLGIWNYDGNI